ncbi:Peptidase M16C associated [Caloramator mitchellensis]|uniref:Peptidase M16C associated n=1 Tax=Caloramator mitchellensis TaxID=908809 RepID=A0A0R3JUB8_CALMK|nr:insulinase family protein [Caloramator mitchellensis]KRQ87145.1 Peptidase M16C associated [Caloramator mitchellensis]
MEVNNIYKGFRLYEIRDIKEINSKAYIFEHEKTGARLLKIQNEDDNKVFSISFRTPPSDSTGVPHIIEHSVLCGSRKFPVKEPFVELIKGSLQTFLNAMTYPDKTMYPVASKNEKDFFNLMDVYLDAVFYPNIYQSPEILMQEGWHYELLNKEDELVYRGVVYNEMKGAFSSPEAILFRRISETLYPDTTYGVESGGDPDHIPELTYEEFIDFHKKFYHPSNSYIYLYGNGDVEKELEFIDNYLKEFERTEVYSEIEVQPPFEEIKEIEMEYPIAKDDDEREKTFLSLNFAMGDARNVEESTALEILEHILLGTFASPLKKALIDAGLGKDVFGSYEGSILQPMFSIIVKGSEIDKKEKFKEVVFSTLKNLVRDGIDKKLIEASINKKEFEMREAEHDSAPKGLLFGIKLMNSWLYDGHPTAYLEYDVPLQNIKKALTERYFEDLIEKYLLNNKHASVLILKPKKGLLDEKERTLKEKLQEIKKSMTDEEIQKIIDNTKNLLKRQETPDSKEALETIPLLSIKDIDRKAEKLPMSEKNVDGVKYLYHPVFTNKIAYTNFYFDLDKIDVNLLPYVSLLANLLGKVDTENYTYEELAKEIDINIGGIKIYPQMVERIDNIDEFKPILVVESKSLMDKLPKMLELVGEIINKSKFDNSKKIREIIQQTKSRLEMAIIEKGHTVALKRLSSYISKAGKINEIMTGIEFYKVIANIEKNYENMQDELIHNLNKVKDAIFNINNLLLSLTCEEKDENLYTENIHFVLSDLKKDNLVKANYDLTVSKDNEGLLTQANVQYVAKGYNYRKLGYNYNGAMQVLRTIISLDYLWNKVRVQGGAYGCFMNIERNGTINFASYRDPNIKETLRAYDDVPKYIETIEVDEREMTKYIIGTMSKYDYPLNPFMKGRVSDEQYMRGITYDDIQREREEVLDSTLDTIKEAKEMLSEMLKQEYICVLGNENKIRENENIFNKLVKVFE